MHDENTYSCRSYANTCKSCTNELAWLDWNIVSHQSFIVSQKKKYGSTVILWFTFGLNHNLRILFLLKSDCLTK